MIVFLRDHSATSHALPCQVASGKSRSGHHAAALVGMGRGLAKSVVLLAMTRIALKKFHQLWRVALLLQRVLGICLIGQLALSNVGRELRRVRYCALLELIVIA